MAWINFPLTDSSSHATCIAAAQEIYDACVERGFSPGYNYFVRPEPGLKIKFSWLTGIQNVIDSNLNVNGWGYVEKHNNAVDWDVRYWKGKNQTNPTSQAANLTTGEFGFQNIYEHVFGPGRTSFTADVWGKKLDYELLNEMYEILNTITGKVTAVNRDSNMSWYKEAENNPLGGYDDWAEMLAAMDTLPWIYTTVNVSHSGLFLSVAFPDKNPPLSGRPNGDFLLRRSLNRYYLNPLSKPIISAVITFRLKMESNSIGGTPFDMSYSEEWRESNSILPSTIENARAWGTLVETISGNRQSWQTAHLHSFNGWTAGQRRNFIAVPVVAQDNVDNWGMPFPATPWKGPNGGWYDLSATTGYVGMTDLQSVGPYAIIEYQWDKS